MASKIKRNYDIIVAENSGFCFGVKRAVQKAYEILKQNVDNKSVYLLGDIIHNPVVVKEIDDLGGKRIENLAEIVDKSNAILIIRSHGAPRQLIDAAQTSGIEVIDLTCPFVKKIDNYIEQLLKENYFVIIIGDSHHPEVMSLLETFDNKILVIENLDDLKNKIQSKTFDKLGVVAQTTQTFNNFKDCVAMFIDISKELRVFNTICASTEVRQASTERISNVCDIMLVIGGKKSANTKRLYEISKKNNDYTYQIETVNDLKKEWFIDKKKIGITAGASTPGWIIDEVVEYIHKLKLSLK